MEVMAKLQSALGTSKLGYTGLSCAYSLDRQQLCIQLELIDAQVHATGGLVVVCVRLDLFAVGSLETFT